MQRRAGAEDRVNTTGPVRIFSPLSSSHPLAASSAHRFDRCVNCMRPQQVCRVHTVVSYENVEDCASRCILCGNAGPRHRRAAKEKEKAGVGPEIATAAAAGVRRGEGGQESPACREEA